MRGELFVAVVLLGAVVVGAVPGVWTTMTSVPSLPHAGVAIALEDQVLFVCMSVTHVLDTTLDTWVAVAPKPSASRIRVAAVASPTGALVVAGTVGGLPSPLLESFDKLTQTWTIKTSMPTARYGVVAASDGQKMWVSSGQPSNSNNEEYDVAADTWISRQPHPSTCDYASGDYYNDNVFQHCGPNGVTHVYAVSSDSWTTAQRPPSVRGPMYDAVAGTHGFMYLVGGSGGPAPKLEVYTVAADTWTVLDNIPKPGYATAVAITSSGLLISVGHFPGGGWVHAYDTGYATASLTGDPEVVTFEGDRLHLDLFRGVFSLLATAGVVVNALVDVLSTLPPDENTVLTMVGVVGQLPGGLIFQADCGCQNSGEFFCQSEQWYEDGKKIDSPAGLVSVYPNRYLIQLPSLLITIHFRSREVWVYSHNASLIGQLPPASWLDVEITSVAPLSSCTGLLCAVDRSSVHDHEISSGYLMETFVGRSP